jgi:hypothetical protein
MRSPLNGPNTNMPLWQQQGTGGQAGYELKLDPETEAMMLALCAEGKLDPQRCAEMRLRREQELAKLGITTPSPWVNPTVPNVRLPSLNDPAIVRAILEQSYKPLREWFKKHTALLRSYSMAGLLCKARLEVPEAKHLGDGDIEMLAWEWAESIAHTIPNDSISPALCETKAATPPPAAGKLPDIGLDKILKHKLNLYIGTLEINLPESAELKFTQIPLKGATSILIRVKGEITKLGDLLSGTGDGTPAKVSLGVALNGIPKLQVEAIASVDAGTKTISTGLNFTIAGGTCHFNVPYSAVDAIYKAEADLRKYAPAPDTPPSAAQAPDDLLAQMADIAKIADTLYKAIKEIEDAKAKCVQGPKIGVGPFVNIPYGDPKAGDPNALGPVWGFGFKGQF